MYTAASLGRSSLDGSAGLFISRPFRLRHPVSVPAESSSAYRPTLVSILVSRSLFHIEIGSPDENRLHLSDFELASRLSYCLWSSMPDDLLFAAARRGNLSTSKGLAAQLDRMIADHGFSGWPSAPLRLLNGHRSLS